MLTHRRIIAVCAFACLLALSICSGAAAAPYDLLKLAPAGWPVVVRIDATEATASGAYIQKAYSDPELKKLDESFSLGIAKLVSALGIEIPVQADMIPWLSERAVIAVNPPSKGGEPQMLVAVSSSDGASAEKWLSDVGGSVMRNTEPAVQQLPGAKLYSWKLGEGQPTLCYAVGDGFVIFADSQDTVEDALGASASPNAAAAAIASNNSDLVAFWIDPTEFVSGKDPGEKPGAKQAMLQGMKLQGGVSAGPFGMALKMQAPLSEPLKLATKGVLAGAAPGFDAAAMVPSSALAYLTLASTAALQPMLGGIGAKQELEMMRGAIALSQALPGSPMAVALMNLVPRPGLLAVAEAPDDAAADAALAKLRTAMAKMGLTARPGQGSALGLTELKDKAKIAGYLGRNARSVFVASDFRSAQKAARLKAEDSLASRESFLKTRQAMPAPRLAEAWISTEFISAIGYMYDGVGASYFPLTRWIADSLKSTTGMAAAVAATDEKAEAAVALSTDVGPGTSALAAYMGLLAGVILMDSRQATLEGPLPEEQEITGAQSDACLAAVSLAVLEYCRTHKGAFPDPATWAREVQPGVEGTPDQSSYADYEYRMNPYLKGLKLKDLADRSKTILLYEINKDKNETGIWTVPDGNYRFVYVDGQVVNRTNPPTMAEMKPKLKGSPRK